METEKIFFEHIGSKLSLLAKAYKNALEDLLEESLVKKVSADTTVNYTIVLSRLNRAITAFKREMKLSLQDYHILRDIDAISQNAAKHIEGELNELKNEYDKFNKNKNISEDSIKKSLGVNYNFHKNLQKFTVDTILDYFETNYLLQMEKE